MRTEDLIGKKFGKLTIIAPAETRIKCGRYIKYCLCSCECGNKKEIRQDTILRGDTKSCGCLLKAIGERSYKHGYSRTRLYKVFRDMKTRCYNKNSPDYKDYGGKCIRICEEWLNDYCSFKEWAENNGYDENAPKMKCTIDRIDFRGNYEPSNCRWISIAEQNRNKTYIKSKWDKSILIQIAEIKSVSRKEVAKALGLKESEIKYILRHFKTTLKDLQNKC